MHYVKSWRARAILHFFYNMLRVFPHGAGGRGPDGHNSWPDATLGIM
jgi:hypothetical protein